MRSTLLAAALVASPLLGGCGGAVYTPRPSPRIQVVPDGSSLVLVKNGKSYPFGPFGGSLEEIVQGNPRAEEEARTYRTRGITGFVLSTVGTVGAGVGAGLIVGNEVRSNPSMDWRVGAVTLTLSGLVLSIVGSVLAGSAQPHLWNAINIYNDGLPAPWPTWTPQPVYPGYPAAPGAAPPAPAAPAPALPGPAAAPFPGVPLSPAPVPAPPSHPPAATAPPAPPR